MVGSPSVCMPELDKLYANIEALLAHSQAQTERIAALEQELNLRKKDLEQAYIDLGNLRKDYKRLHTVHTTLSTNMSEQDRHAAWQRITNMIAQVDRALEVLKQ